MSVSVSDLSPKYQAQAMKKVLEQQGACPAGPAQAKTSKYHNTKAERVTPSGAILRFDSQKEARRYDQLTALAKAGQIQDLRLQVDFTLQEAYTDMEGRRVRAIRYRADFTYRHPATGVLVVEDVKSPATRTSAYLMKKKMLKDKFGLDITEV